jgi:hypothetical protein
LKLLVSLFTRTAAVLVATSAQAAPNYQIDLNARHPTQATVSLDVPADQELALSGSKAVQPTSAPTCGSTPLQQSRPATWLKPKGCGVVSWTATLSDLDRDPFDGSSPVSGWSGGHQLWLLTSSFPWLRFKGQPTTPALITAQIAGRKFQDVSLVPADTSIPLAIVVGKPVRRFRADGFTINDYGEVPTAPQLDRLERSLVSTLAQWRIDLFQQGNRAPDHLNYVWFGPSPGSEPGIFASANSDAILIQYIPDPRSSEPDAKLAAGIFGTGAHEAFHALGAVSGAPAWANESLATYFAYLAARRHLSGEPLRLLSQLVDAPSDRPLVNVEHDVEKGDQTNYGDFYSKGARFWAAIDKVLTVKPNRSGKLAALIGQTNGLKGLNWSNADALAFYFDGFSNGRAGPIVRCYLVQDGCPRRNIHH